MSGPKRLRSPLTRALAPVLGGIAFFVLLALVTWGIAAYLSRSGTEPTERLAPVRLELGAASNRAPDAIYRVTHEGGTAGTTVDQRAGGGIWNPLGEYFFQVDTGYQVRLNDDVAPDTFVSADAIRVRPVGQWDRGELSELPPNAELRALPGGGNGIPSVVSIPPINASRFLER